MNWKTYHNLTKKLPPRPLTIRAIKYVKNKNSALDLGSGSHRDSKLLVKNFSTVVGVDKEYFKPLANSNFHFVQSNFKSFKYSSYNFVNAQFSLPFLQPKDFKKVWRNIIKSLEPKGILCVILFGKNDTWAGNTEMTFHTKDDIHKLLNGLEILNLREVEKESKTAQGYIKHWHVFNIIAKKIK